MKKVSADIILGKRFKKKTKKKKKGIFVKLLIPANNATVTPPLGPTLGQYGINIQEFCSSLTPKQKK